jgi:molecular chaperone GrpE
MSTQQDDTEEKAAEIPIHEDPAAEEVSAGNSGADTDSDVEIPADDIVAEWHSSENTGTEGSMTDEALLNEKIATLEAQAADLTAQLAEAQDQLLRKTADFENFRKRMNQDKQSSIEFANQSLLLDIIPIIDDFERAIQSADASKELIELPAGKAMLEGIIMIEKHLTSQLEHKWGLKRFNSAGEPFDPNFHEAMFMEKSPDAEEPVVQEDLIKGYMLKDRVIRAAKVKVIMPEDSEQAAGSSE